MNKRQLREESKRQIVSENKQVMTQVDESNKQPPFFNHSSYLSINKFAPPNLPWHTNAEDGTP